MQHCRKNLNNDTGNAMPLYACKVRAGFPSPADDYIERYLDLNTYLVKHPASTFFVTAFGDSMSGAGIASGDILIIDKSLDAKSGDIVLAALNGELIIKRLLRLNGRIQLLSTNKVYKPLEITNDEELVIWGVVTYVIHKAV